MTSSNAAAQKPDEQKAHEKLAEKRRALGRGLESLLPGPRVVAPAPAAPAVSQSVRKDGAPGIAAASAASAESDSGGPGTAGLPSPASTVLEQVQAAAGPAFDGEAVMQVALTDIDLNPYQTRREFDPAALQELSKSIAAQGVLQPIVLRPGKERKFILVLGERRLRASNMAGKSTIPAIVKRVSAQQAAEMTLVENLQRQDLNCIEQAEAFANLSTNFNLTQEEIGARVGLSREAVSNYMRLLTLPESVIGALQTGRLNFSHARLLLRLGEKERIWSMAKRVMEEKWSVAKLEDTIVGMVVPGGVSKGKTGGEARWVDPNVRAAQRSLETVLGMKVRIRDRSGRGKIVIEYGTLEDFDRVVGMLKGK